MQASQLTPSQVRFNQEHRDRQMRIAAAARPAARPPAAVCIIEIEPQPEPSPPPVDPVIQWTERQIEKYKPLWFGVPVEIETPEKRRPRIEDIQRAVAAHYNVGRSDILSARRTAVVVKPRQVAMYLAKSLTLKSLPEIGRRFGGRDHTTVLHAVRKIERLVQTDEDLALDVAAITSAVEAKLETNP